MKDALFNISTNPFLAIPSMPELISKFSLVDGDQDQSTEADNPPEDVDEGGDDDDADLCQSLHRLATRRVTDFSQVKSWKLKKKFGEKNIFILFQKGI